MIGIGKKVHKISLIAVVGYGKLRTSKYRVTQKNGYICQKNKVRMHAQIKNIIYSNGSHQELRKLIIGILVS